MGMSVPERRVIVVGGGAAGMMASIFAGKAGARVTLLERGEKLGKKVYITGKGRCNVTNDCTLDEFLREVARNPRFLYSALSFFSPQDMMQLLEDAGCPVVVQRGRRVFPATEKASDVTRTLARLMQQSGVEVRYGSRVQALMTETAENGAAHVTGVRLMDGTALPAERVILATGGLSCPLTGSTGDGYRLGGFSPPAHDDPAHGCPLRNRNGLRLVRAFAGAGAQECHPDAEKRQEGAVLGFG